MNTLRCPRCSRVTVSDPALPSDDVTRFDQQLCMSCIYDDEGSSPPRVTAEQAERQRWNARLAREGLATIKTTTRRARPHRGDRRE